MATSNKESVKILFTILFILYVVSFFHFILYPAGLWAIGWKLELPFIAIQIFLLVSTHIYKKILFRKLFKWYFILIVINMFTCLFFRKQGLLVSLYAWTPLLLIFYYPFFKYLRISTRGWEKVLFSLFIIILIGYTLQNIFLNTPLFVLNSTEEQLENETRVRIWSNNILTLGGFYCFNKYLCGKKLYLILFLWTAILIFLQGARTGIAGFALVSVIMYFKIRGLSWKVIPAAGLAAILLFFFARQQVFQNKVDEIVTRNETANMANDTYPRVTCFNYYMNEHFKSNLEYFWGSGKTVLIEGDTPLSKAPSEYSKLVSTNAALYHWYTADLGLLGLSWEAGIPFIVIFYLLFIAIIRKKVPQEYYYIGMWELFLLIVSTLLSESIYCQCNMVFHALALVILDRVAISGTQKFTKTVLRTTNNNENSNIKPAI